MTPENEQRHPDKGQFVHKWARAGMKFFHIPLHSLSERSMDSRLRGNNAPGNDDEKDNPVKGEAL